MTTITRFTKEQLIKRLEEQQSGARYALSFVQDSEILRDIEMDLRITEIARASLEAEPDYIRYDCGCCGWETLKDWSDNDVCPKCNHKPMGKTELFTAPPAPVVPTFDEWLEVRGNKPLGWVKDSMREAYDACRAAMLQGKAEPVSNRDELPEEKAASLQLRNLIRQRHGEWSDKTFGNVGPVGPLKHLSKEALEAAAEPDDLSEWADMQFLLWDAQRRAGISDGEITAAMEEKLKVNMARQWPEPKDGEPRLHIKEQSESVLPEIECDICGHVSTDPEGRHHCCEDNSND